MISIWIFSICLILLIHTYLIYPACGVVLGAGRNDHLDDSLVSVSFLVPAHNESAVIQEKISNFLAIDYPPELTELLIADDASTDDTAALVRQYVGDRIGLVQGSDRSGKAALMNRLVKHAKHPYLLFSDANVMLSKNALRRLVDQLGNPRIGAITGEVKLIDSDREFSVGESLYYWLEQRIQVAESRIGSVMGVDGGMYLLRAELFQELPEDTILDDFVVSMNVIRGKHSIAYESAAKATEGGTPTAQQEFARRVRIAAGAVQLVKRWNVPKFTQPILWLQFISHKLLRWLSPVLLLSLLFSNLLTLPHGILFQVALGIQLLFYSLLLVAWLARGCRQTRLGSVLFYFGMSQVAITIGLIKGLFDLQPAQWEKAQRQSARRSTHE